MNRNLKLAMAGAGLAGCLALNPLSAAMKAGEYLNGQWGSSDGGGRGATLTYVPNPDGSGTLFGLVFGYEDASGDNVWLQVQTSLLENQFRGTGDILLVEGGNFGFPVGAPSQTSIGTFEVVLNSCGNVQYTFDFDNGSGFEDTVWDLDSLTERSTGEFESCVYKQEFTGCPDFATEIPTLERACLLNGDYDAQDLLLTNDTTWVFSGLVEIGGIDPTGATTVVDPSTLTIEPGTVLIGAGDTADFLYVNPGSKIFANGTKNAPIVWTSAFDGFQEGVRATAGDVGGIVIAGNAQCNSPEVGTRCRSEFREDLLYGLSENFDNNDSSGEISYFQIRYAGIEFQPDREVNAWTFQGVGRGTNIHHIQAYRGADDGIEFFGGTANVKYSVFSAGEDDGIDWDIGWSGKMQYSLITYNAAFGGDHGFESANNPSNDDALPRAQPVLSNVSVILDASDAENGSGIRFKEGTAGQVWNSIVTGSNNACLEFVDVPTYTAAGTPASPSGITAFAGTLLSSGGCPVVFKDQSGAPYSLEDLFEAFPGNDVVADLMLDGYQPMPGSPALDSGLQVFELGTGDAEEFFDTTAYSGAFDGTNDWTEGWTHDIFGEAAAE